MFHKSEGGVYLSDALRRIQWLEHGFGTRLAQPTADNLFTLRQVHSNRVLKAEGRPGTVGEGDALVTDTPGLWLGVRTADCLPILLADQRRRAVAAVHAGWRGTTQGVAAEAVRTMRALFETDPADLLAAIGPGIGACCFEVGPEVAGQFKPLFPERTDLNIRKKLDLAEANTRQLLQAGIPAEQIFRSTLCTCCTPLEFHSWRRERSPGRMLSAISIRA